eukprot:COSAG03_NODE_598_length_6798_cov_39.483654_9_plen_58_part_00
MTERGRSERQRGREAEKQRGREAETMAERGIEIGRETSKPLAPAQPKSQEVDVFGPK